MPDFISLISLADKLGALRAVKDKLLRQPDPAADKLVAVLGELSKIYNAIDGELVRYLSLHFDPAVDLAEERARLLTLEGGQIQTRVNEARGHCHKIGNIYQRYLSRWFHDALTPAEADLLDQIFRDFTYADNSMLYALHELTTWLTQEASQTLTHVDAGELGEANRRVRAARQEILPARRAIGRAMSDLLDLQAEFIEAAGTV
jgi:hypothetical protein